MNISIENLICNKIPLYKETNRVEPFLIVKYEFNYQSEKLDKSILNKIANEGNILANSVNDMAANDSTTIRSKERKLSNAIAGVLAEYCWKNFLNTVSLKLLVKETVFDTSASQIDLKTIDTNQTIEVRSSFPRNGIHFAICHNKYEFDILGPYSNNYKPTEPQKDFYLRTLYHIPTPISFLEEYKKDSFTVYLTGGATWKMIADDKIAIEKSLVPEDDFGNTEIESTFRVIPFSKALDCNEIYKIIKDANNTNQI